MAISSASVSSESMGSPKRFLVGTNVVVMTLLVFAIVAVVQAFAFWRPARFDMTSSGVNSLSDGTKKLLDGLHENIRLTSLYFETDREDADQARYRQAVQNLIELYEATNRSKVTAEWVNPLKDHEKFQNLLSRLRSKEAFKSDLETYLQRIDHYKNDLAARILQLLQSEQQTSAAVSGGVGEAARDNPVAQVEDAFRRLEHAAQAAREQVDALTSGAIPEYTAAVNELKTLYSLMTKSLKDIAKFGAAEIQRNPSMPAAQANFLREANNRYADLVAALEAETTAIQGLKPLKLDELIAQLKPTSNAILVESEKDARIVDFASTWPPVDANMGGERVPYERRGFKGEEKLTSAILRATHKQQTAVVFVRYGGQPLFLGGFLPGQPPAAYAMVKQQLEDANFIVEEWDLKTKMTLPDIDPKPTRTIFVILKPEPPQRGPMGQPNPQDLPFGEQHRKAVLDALANGGRALFIAGWAPGPMGPIPSAYEYAEYLKNNWGITVDTSTLLIEVIQTDPGEYRVGRQDFHFIRDLEVTDHPIVREPMARLLTFPSSAPLILADPAPEGVKLERLVYMPKRDGIWGVKNLQTYQAQLNERDYLTRAEGDLEGPFDLAVAATKGDSKVVVVSSRMFAEDNVAFARVMALTAQGIEIRSRNPGNPILLVNSLHWLNDDESAMGIGRPIDASVLQIPSTRTVKTVQALTIFGWPLLALAGGGVAWWVRRK